MTETKAVQQKKPDSILKEGPWENLEAIKKILAPDLTMQEFGVFVRRGIAMGANPWMKETVPVIFNKNRPEDRTLAFIDTRDLRVKNLQKIPGYLKHKSCAVYEKDEFKMSAAMDLPEHYWDETKDRGKLLGAWAAVWIARDGKEQIIYDYFKIGPFRKTGKDSMFWDKYPELMIKKVAEAHIASMACKELFSKSYSEGEVILENGSNYAIEVESTPKLPDLSQYKEAAKETDEKERPPNPDELGKLQILCCKAWEKENVSAKLKELLPGAGVEEISMITNWNDYREIETAVTK